MALDFELTSDIAPLSEEAQKGEVFGIVRLYNVNNPSKPEASADVLLSPTPKTLFQPLVLTCLMVVFSSWRKPSFPGPETLFISLGGILRHICFYRKSETSPSKTFNPSRR